MIRYALRCDQAHRFDSWFGSSADFERLHGCRPRRLRGLRQSSAVEKDLMAPSVAGAAAERPLSGAGLAGGTGAGRASPPDRGAAPRTSAATSPPRRGASTRASPPSGRSSARRGPPRRAP